MEEDDDLSEIINAIEQLSIHDPWRRRIKSSLQRGLNHPKKRDSQTQSTTSTPICKPDLPRRSHHSTSLHHTSHSPKLDILLTAIKTYTRTHPPTSTHIHSHPPPFSPTTTNTTTTTIQTKPTADFNRRKIKWLIEQMMNLKPIQTSQPSTNTHSETFNFDILQSAEEASDDSN
ncbi:hypothetical protein NEHOM01_1083 [Nematocida homosporus]|uniref:uncharacterized protein n=1 Tax=Nematocida homosporus TaxID=1912981 RepID=UPI002220AFCC|nr:uncharacterized protein NEHOM01_1083 [Nematocida homosporus]KAI5185806.1 hypothetical protein NEHOM01_1083 [Nematocida homosporus]